MSCPILCVEDDPDIGRLLTSILVQAGHQPTWVSTGEEALHRWLLRRRKAMEERTSSTLMKIKALEIDIDGYSVKFDGNMIQLTTREFALLVFFARHPGKGFSRS